MILELYGNPGVGKTTVVNAAIEKLEAQGFKCLSYSDIYMSRNKYYKVIKALFSIRQIHINKEIIGLNYKINKCKNVKYAIALMVMVNSLLTQDYEKCDVVLLDEGILQLISSLSFQKDISEYPVHLLINEIKKEIGLIYTIRAALSLDENLDRILCRGVSKNTRFLNIDSPDETRKNLDEKLKNLEYLSSYFVKAIDIDMSMPVNYNAEIITEYVCNVSAQ